MKILKILKRVFQIILTIIISVILIYCIDFLGTKLDEKFVFQKCIECPSVYHLASIYILFSLYVIGFVFIIVYLLRKRTLKFWVLNSLITLLFLIICCVPALRIIFSPKTNPLPITLKVFPSDQTRVFYDKNILNSNDKEPLTGFIIDSEKPIPIRIENGKIQNYQGGTNLYELDNTEEKNRLCYNKKGEPLTGFLVANGEHSMNILECVEGKREGNGFHFIKDKETSLLWLAGWIYSSGGRISHMEGYYKNGTLNTESVITDNTFIGRRYYPDGQLMLNTSSSNESNLQQLFYDGNGHLSVYLDEHNFKFLCVFPDGSSRKITSKELIHYWAELDDSSLLIRKKEIPSFHCD